MGYERAGIFSEAQPLFLPHPVSKLNYKRGGKGSYTKMPSVRSKTRNSSDRRSLMKMTRGRKGGKTKTKKFKNRRLGG